MNEKEMHIIMTEKKKYKIGILGAGQLGLYLSASAQKKCGSKSDNWCVFFENADDPAAIFFPKNAIKLEADVKKRKKQLENCECIILESEFYSYEELKQIHSRFIPDIHHYKNFYGKTKQRLFYQSLGLNSPRFWIINDVAELDNIDSFPVILKKDLFSYDGNGNRECKNHHDLHRYAVLLGLPLLCEVKLDLKSEFAVGVVTDGEHWMELPLTETVQKNHICHYVLGPLSLEEKYSHKLKIELEKIKKAKLIGLFAFEFFITKDDEVIINEGAARPHNSQHLTMDLCEHSQFDLIVDLALKSPFPSTNSLKASQGAMINLLGKSNCINPTLKMIDIPSQFPHSVYMYGKKEGRIGRKLGHLNILNLNQTDREFVQILDRIYEGYDL